MMDRKATARDELQKLRDCERMAADIMAFRDQPTVASDEEMGIQELGDQISSALESAGLRADVIDGMYPQSERRLGDTPYMQKPTQLVCRQVPLPQLAVFLYDLSDDTGLRIRDLRLRVPRDDQNNHAWDVDATLTYLIYSPVSSAGR